MVRISRIQSKVQFQIDCGVLENYYELNITCSNDLHAELLRRAFSEHLMHNLQRVREEAYRQGWKDAKAKVAKRTWFSGTWR